MEEKKEITQEVEGKEDSYKSGSMHYIDSREVAEIVEKEHKNLVRDIKRYGMELTKLNFELSDFFVESSYGVKGQNRRYPCYRVTRKGCEFIAHKLTGIKGTKFTATYINRFHEMEDTLDGKRQDQIVSLLQRCAEQQEELARMMEHQGKSEQGKAERGENPYLTAGEGIIECRKEKLYGLTSKVAELCGKTQNKILHYMYLVLEDTLGITLNSYKAVYCSETGHEDASMVEAIAANDRLFEAAVEMNQSVIERKRIYG